MSEAHTADFSVPQPIAHIRVELGALGKQAEAFGTAMKKAGATIEVKMIKDRDHGSIMRNVARLDDEVTKAIFVFINKK